MRKNQAKNLSVSFVIPTFNSEKTLSDCLSSIDSQEYPKDNIEVILADGGSKDRTFSIAKKYSAKVINITSDKQGAEYNRAVGAHKARNTILVFLDHDNILPHKKWLAKMTEPFHNHEDVIGVETLRYGYNKSDGLLGRYFSLFCINDVVPFYLGKADRLSYIFNSLKEYGVYKKADITSFRNYSLVKFNKDFIPTLGSNGFLIRRDILFKNARVDLEHFFHIDINVDLIKKGFNTYAFVDDVINHATEERGLFDYVNRRRLFVEKYHFENLKSRRYSVYEKKDLVTLLSFVVISLTFVKPFIDSLRGFYKIKDWAWFLHPVMCILIVCVYGFSVIKYGVRKII